MATQGRGSDAETPVTSIDQSISILSLLSQAQVPAQSAWAVPNNLPAQLTPFIGREAEMADVCTLLRRTSGRLVTLTGLGGVGKTRLGLQVAAHLLEDFADGVYFVSLAPLSQPDLVLPALAQTFDLKETPDWLPLEQLKTYLHEKRLLLLLDNFEQVVAAAPLLVALLRACPALKVLVTSRVRLRVSGEHVFSVQPLAVPDPHHLPDHATLLKYAAVALFVQRAQTIKPDFQLTAGNARTIAEICLHLDGLPLAIELAAARIKLLSPQALLARLSQRLQVLTGGVQDAPARQQTLRNTIAWSYDLLDAAEQRLFRHLSVFVGGCTLEAIEALCTALDGGAEEVLDGVTSLLDKSLLQQIEQGEEPRLMMLETIREYGLEALIVSGELENTRQAHALYCLAFAEEAAPNLYGAEQQSWFARLERERDNLRAAFNCLIARNEAELTLRLGNALKWFWLIHGPLSEGRRFLEQALSGSEGILPSVRANVLGSLGLMLINQGDYNQAKGRCEESVALYRELGDRDGMAWPLHHLAMVEFYQGEFTRARSLLEECLAFFSERGNMSGRAYALDHLALLLVDQGEYDKARSYAQEGLTLFRALEDTIGVGDALFSLVRALIASQGGKAVHPLLEEILALARETGDEVNMVNALHIAGCVALSEGDFPSACSYIEESLALTRAQGARADIAELLAVLAQITATQGDYVAAQALYEESLAHAKELGFKRIIPTSLEGLAAAVVAQGEPTWATYLWGAAESLRQTIGAPLPPIEQANYEQALAAARTQLGEAAFAAAWQEGRTMTPEQALAARGAATSPPPTLAEAPSTAPAKTASTYPGGLTAREMEVLRLLAQGMTSQQIAERFIISLHTVNAHVRSIYTKLELNSRSALTRYAIEQHLL